MNSLVVVNILSSALKVGMSDGSIGDLSSCIGYVSGTLFWYGSDPQFLL